MRHCSLRASFAALLLIAADVPSHAVEPVRAGGLDVALRQLASEQIALAVQIRKTSSDPLVVALARSMEASHRRLQHAIGEPASAFDASHAALPDDVYVERVLVAHRAALAQCAQQCSEDDVAMLRSRIAMARAMQNELADRNFYTALETTD